MADGYVLELVFRTAGMEAFSGYQCFACGEAPTSGHGEHVIPRWVQRKFGLYDKRLTLINGTHLPYRQLTIPCCELCNNGFLRDLENQVIEMLEHSAKGISRARLTLGRWLCKIFLGILIKETTLLVDRRAPSRGSILPPEFLDEFKHAQLILQSGRKPTKFRSLHGNYPFTVYLYRIHQDEDFGDFDLSTNLHGQSIAIRLGPLGMIFVNDGGLQNEVGPKGPLGLDGRKLHPIQFSEVAAWVHYKATLRDATHTYVTTETPTHIEVEQAAVRPSSYGRTPTGELQIFRSWDDVECARMVDRYRSADWGPVYNPVTGRFTTSLRNRNGGLPSPKRFVRANDTDTTRT